MKVWELREALTGLDDDLLIVVEDEDGLQGDVVHLQRERGYAELRVSILVPADTD